MNLRAAFQNKLLINLVIALVIFLASVLVRLDNLKSPMGRHHEWLTGHVLTTLSIFEKNGAAQHYFAPVWTYNTTADRAMVVPQKFKDKNNYVYYVSYPPFCFIFPYLCFKLTGATVSVAGIRIIGLINHFLCAFLVLLILNRFFNRSIKKEIFIPGYIAYAMYLFASGNLWYHSNVYFADMLVHLFILSSILIFIHILDAPHHKTWKKATLISLTTFFGVYTEWLAVFIAFFMCMFLFFYLFKDRKYFLFILVIGLSTLLSIGLSVVQFSQIAGFELLKEQNLRKYKGRSGFDEKAAEGGFSVSSPVSKNRVFEHYELNYSSLMDYAWLCLYFVLALVILNWIRRKNQLRINHTTVFLVVICAITLHHTAFFNFTVVHDFSTLKSSILMTLFIGYMCGLLIDYFENISVKRGLQIGLVAVTAWFIHCSIQKYYSVNRHDWDEYFQSLAGETAKKFANDDELVFINGYNTPVMWYYAQRNVYEAPRLEDAINFLKFANYPKGIHVQLDPIDHSYRVSVYRFNSAGDTTRLMKELIQVK